MKTLGRKPLFDEPMTVTSVYLPASMKQFVEDRNEKLSPFLRNFIKELMEKETEHGIQQ